MTQESPPDRPGRVVGWVDERPAIAVARDVWGRENEAGRRLMIREVTRTGHRLVVVDCVGATWSPSSNPAA